MAEISYPFDAGSGAILTEDDWSEMAKNWQDDGVVADSTASAGLAVTSLSQPNTAILGAGTAIIQGFMYRNTADLDLTFSTNSSGQARKDRVVLRLDRNTNVIQAVVKEGTPSGSPVAPSLNTTYPIYEISLATFTVNAGSSVVNGSITRDYPMTSRRIRVSDVPGAGHPQGSIVYSPSGNTFWMIGPSGTFKQIGEPVTVSGNTIETGFEDPLTGADGDFFYNINEYRLKAYDAFEEKWMTIGRAGYHEETVRRFSDQTLTTTSLTTDTQLQLTPPATGASYLFEGTVYYSCNTANQSMAFSLAGPGTSSSPSPKIRYEYQTNSSAAPQLTSGATYPQTTNIGSVAAGTIYTVKFEIVATLTNNFPLVCRYQPASGSVQWTIYAGSWMKLTRLD